jgi:hypothetical protein
VGRGVEQGADCLNGMSAFTDDLRDVAFASSKMKDHLVLGLGLRENNLVWKLNELTDDEPKEFLHAAGVAYGATFFRALLMMLPTVCDGLAPTPTQ